MNFKTDFYNFCESEYENSNKASSYVNAITYLCDYLKLNVDSITNDDLKLIKSYENLLSMKSSDFYKDLLNFLSSRRQSSYLTNGFIKAALGYLFKFYDFE